jgi:hypothetical protein
MMSTHLVRGSARLRNAAIVIVAKCDDLRMRQLLGDGVADESIYGEWSGAAHHEGREAGYIQQIDLITWWPKLRTSRGYGEELN